MLAYADAAISLLTNSCIISSGVCLVASALDVMYSAEKSSTTIVLKPFLAVMPRTEGFTLHTECFTTSHGMKNMSGLFIN
jgi:hypothetical protein